MDSQHKEELNVKRRNGIEWVVSLLDWRTEQREKIFSFQEKEEFLYYVVVMSSPFSLSVPSDPSLPYPSPSLSSLRIVCRNIPNWKQRREGI